MKKLFNTLIASVLALSIIPAVPAYAEDTSDYTCEIKELPYEATVVSSIGGDYFELNNKIESYLDDQYHSLESLKQTKCVINANGDIVIPDTITPLNYHFSNGIFSLTSGQLGKGYMTLIKGNTLFESNDFTIDNETIIIKPKFYDENGKILFDSSSIRTATPMNDGYAVVLFDRNSDDPDPTKHKIEECIIDKNGDITFTIDPDVSDYWVDGMMNLFDQDKYTVVETATGWKIFWDTQYYSEGAFLNVIAILTNNPQISYIDFQGKDVIVLNDMYSYAGAFHSGLSLVKQEDKYGFINKKDDIAIPIEYDAAYDFGTVGNSYTVVEKNSQWKYIDTNGKEIFDIGDYTSIGGTNGKVVIVGKDDKMGAVDLNNNVILPFEYDDISGIQNDTCMAVKDGKVYSIHFKSNAASSLGDFTGDNIIDGRDASAVLTLYAKSSVGDTVITADQLAAGDVNKDNILDGRDATAILTYYAKTSTGYAGTLEDFIKSQA